MAHLGKTGCQPAGPAGQEQPFLSKAAPAGDAGLPPNAGPIILTESQQRIVTRILEQAQSPTAAWTRKR